MFGPVEKAALLFLGFVLILGIGEGSKIKGLAMIGLGLLLGTVGVDLVSGEERFVFDVSPLRDGFGIAVVAMGLFGISEVLLMAEGKDKPGEVLNYRQSLRDLLPNRAETAGIGRAGAARQRARILPRAVARRRRDDGELCQLHDGAKALAPPGAVRQGRGRGRRGPGGRQQCRRAGELHSRCSASAFPPMR